MFKIIRIITCMKTLGQLKNIIIYYTNQLLEKPHMNKQNAHGAILDN